MTLTLLIEEAAKLRRESPDLRYGQALMNALATLDPALHSEISGSDLDPFYDDKRIGRFYEARP